MENELLELLSAWGLQQVQQAAAWMPRTDSCEPIEADRQQDRALKVTSLAVAEQDRRGLEVSSPTPHRSCCCCCLATNNKLVFA